MKPVVYGSRAWAERKLACWDGLRELREFQLEHERDQLARLVKSVAPLLRDYELRNDPEVWLWYLKQLELHEQYRAAVGRGDYGQFKCSLSSTKVLLPGVSR